MIFGSNTSTLPITSLATEFKDPAQLHRHPFLLAGRAHDAGRDHHGQEDRATRRSPPRSIIVRAIRKTPIVVNDSRGFYANRCVLNYIREGHIMLMEGVPPAMIENVAPHGRNAGRAAVAQRRGRDRSRLEDPQGDRSRPRTRSGRSGAEGAAAGPWWRRRAARPQERQGLLRLSRRSGPKRLWPGLAELQTTKLDPDAIDVDGARSIVCW